MTGCVMKAKGKKKINQCFAAAIVFFYNSDELQCDLDMIVKPDNRQQVRSRPQDDFILL